MSDADQTRRIRIGTSGYSYPGPPPKGWLGVFYPETKGKRFDDLAYYSEHFDTVEINTTFYRPPLPQMAEGWVRRTPSHFEFAVKVWQKFTHSKRVGDEVGGGGTWERSTRSDVEIFLKGIGPLAEGGKLGALLFQYPPGFHYSQQNAEKLRSALRAFENYPKVVELRHRSWSDGSEETTALLSELGASWAIIDEPKFASSVRQNFEPVGELLYFRAHGRNAQSWWHPPESWMRYDYFYNAEEIKQLARELTRATQEKANLKKAFAFFNNHARGQAVANAIMLSHEMGNPMKGSPIQELVRTFPQISGLIPAPTQETLF